MGNSGCSGKASSDRVALPNLRCMLGVSVFPSFTELWHGLGIFNVRTYINACDCTRSCTGTVRESALEVDSWRKIPRRTGESNLRQRRAAPTLYQLSYTPRPLCRSASGRPTRCRLTWLSSTQQSVSISLLYCWFLIVVEVRSSSGGWQTLACHRGALWRLLPEKTATWLTFPAHLASVQGVGGGTSRPFVEFATRFCASCWKSQTSMLSWCLLWLAVSSLVGVDKADIWKTKNDCREPKVSALLICSCRREEVWNRASAHAIKGGH